MIRLFVIGEKLVIDKTERATNVKQVEYGLDQIHPVRLLMIGGVLLGAIVAHARDIYVPPPPTAAPPKRVTRAPRLIAACDAERRRWELFKCNRKPITGFSVVDVPVGRGLMRRYISQVSWIAPRPRKPQ